MVQKFVLGAVGARKLRALLNGRGESGSIQRNGGGLTFEDDFAPPFTVQWAQSASNGEGSWIIWLPSDELVVLPDGAANPASGLTAVGGDYPTGWYILTDSQLSRSSGGTLYLHVVVGDSPSVSFASSATASGDNELDVPVCRASVDSTSGVRQIRQFVMSVVVVAGTGDGGLEYGCDEASISRIAHTSQSGEADENGNNFYIKGFGKWTVGGGGSEVGSYHAPSESEITLDGDATSFAVICRDGNSSIPNANTLGYRKLKIKGSAGSSPFAYQKSTTTDPETHQPVTLHKLVNCCFYWNGELQSLADFDVSGLLGGGTVYLRGVQSAPSASDPDPDWTWTLGTAEQDEPSGGKALNIKLYDFAQSKVAVDYRTTFLAMADHTQKAKFTVGKPGGDASVVLDASGSSPKLVISDGTNTISLDLADVPSGCGGSFGIHELTFTDGNGDEQTFHGLFCDDIDIPEVVQKTISGGDGISVSVNGNVITITNTRTAGGGSGGSSTSGFTGTKYVVTDVTYNETTHKLEKKVETWVYENGLLKTVNVPASMTEITTAVEETV